MSKIKFHIQCTRSALSVQRKGKMIKVIIQIKTNIGKKGGKRQICTIPQQHNK